MNELKNVLEIVASAEDHASALARDLDSVANRLQEMEITSSAALSEDEVAALLDMKARGVSIDAVVQSAELWDSLENEIGSTGSDLYDLAEISIRQWGAVEDLGYNDSSDIETLVDEHQEYDHFRSEVIAALDDYVDDPRLASVASNEEADGAVHQINLLADNNNNNSKVLDAIKALVSVLEEERVIGSGREL
tara:strand:- start:536 stop:1114 length:579 start_codon:yes stop_codon:yes gene_type:complete